jgi:hypothetical protein
MFLIRSYLIISSSPTGRDFFHKEEIQRKAQAKVLFVCSLKHDLFVLQYA